MAQENDVVLIYFEDKPAGFARIESILADGKKDWYHVKLLLLQTPLQVVTWILKNEYINGDEFTMGGKRMRLDRVVCPAEPDKRSRKEPDVNLKTPSQDASEKSAPKGKVISFSNVKKR